MADPRSPAVPILSAQEVKDLIGVAQYIRWWGQIVIALPKSKGESLFQSHEALRQALAAVEARAEKAEADAKRAWEKCDEASTQLMTANMCAIDAERQRGALLETLKDSKSPYFNDADDRKCCALSAILGRTCPCKALAAGAGTETP